MVDWQHHKFAVVAHVVVVAEGPIQGGLLGFEIMRGIGYGLENHAVSVVGQVVFVPQTEQGVFGDDFIHAAKVKTGRDFGEEQ